MELELGVEAEMEVVTRVKIVPIGLRFKVEGDCYCCVVFGWGNRTECLRARRNGREERTSKRARDRTVQAVHTLETFGV